MLFFQLVTFVWSLYLSLTGLNYNSENYERINGLPENTFTKEYGAFVITTLICSGFVFFVGFLFFQQLYLIAMNISLWEATVGFKITYLKPYPHHFSPFDMGIKRNIASVFCHGNKLQKWELPNPDGENVH